MNDELKETQPTKITPPQEGDTSPVHVASTVEKPVAKKRKRRGWLWIGGALLAVVLVLGISALLGYQQGIKQRTAMEQAQTQLAVAEQFELGLQDMEAGRYEVARQRFEYVINLAPDYPGVTDKLAEVLIILNATATPTPSPVPTAVEATSTPDLRADEELFNQAETHLTNEEWDLAIQTLEQLRKNNPDYRPVDIDGMLYIALRQRGIKKIGLGNLEGGIYDLTLAERFGVLDTEADSWRVWARQYITGASYWDVNWPKAIEYFEQIAATTPNLHDGTGWSASQRYVDALVGYAESLELNAQWCEVDEIYQKAYEYTGDPKFQEQIEQAQENCSGEDSGEEENEDEEE
jgi:tetratricopeptide (TPR) repeat protein